MNRQRDVVILHNIKQDNLAFCCCYLLRLFSLANLFGGFPMKPDLQKKLHLIPSISQLSQTHIIFNVSMQILMEYPIFLSLPCGVQRDHPRVLSI